MTAMARWAAGRRRRRAELRGMMSLPRQVGCGLLFSLAFWAPRTAPADPPPGPPPTAPATDYPGAAWAPASPGNFQPSGRPSPALPIDRIVIHDIEGAGPEAIRWFQNPQAKVSSHYVVDGQTGRVTQLVRERDIAWHAGDHLTNARSVGIEHGGYAYRPGFYNPVEYEASAHLVRAIALRYGIPRDRTHIIGHFEVPDSAHPGHFGGRSGHTDPGPYWDWDYFLALVRNDARSGPAPAPALVVLHPGETVPAAWTLTNTGDDAWPADPTAASDAALRGLGPVYLGAGKDGSGQRVCRAGLGQPALRRLAHRRRHRAGRVGPVRRAAPRPARDPGLCDGDVSPVQSAARPAPAGAVRPDPDRLRPRRPVGPPG